MKPTLIKKACYIPYDAENVVLRIDPESPCKLPEYAKYALVYEDDNCLIKIKPDFISDGGSLPRLVWTLTGLTPYSVKCIQGFLVHDALYGSHLLSQKKADKILLNILCIEPRANLVQRQIVYWTLRAVGHHAYNGKTESQIEQARKYVTVIEK